MKHYFYILCIFFGIFSASAASYKNTSTDYSFCNAKAFNNKQRTYLIDFDDCYKHQSPSSDKQLNLQNRTWSVIKTSCLSQTDTSKTKNLDELTKINQLNKGSGKVQNQGVLATEIDALLLDATFSPGGYDFYVLLSQNWTPPAAAAGYTILVKEYQGRGVNIVVAVEVNGKQLVFRRMRPVYPALNGLAKAVGNYLNGYLARGDHLRGVDADGNFIDVQQTDATKQIKTPFDVY